MKAESFRVLLLAAGLVGALGCSHVERRAMEATAYCPCGTCNGYHRGNAHWLYLDRWNRYVDSGPDAGNPYAGRTANGSKLHTVRSGLFSVDSLRRPWKIPLRLVWLPWFLPQDGTIAADTDYYPFGTRMKVLGWGTGVVADRGSAIRGPDRIDLFVATHGKTERWGRRRVEVEILP
ncbi:MAG: 3D domain-containing protein [Candidatus Sumerlaeota bacterium]|nr:3D domain-containing protein [Candidatus Sumerlaeota bacterium]